MCDGERSARLLTSRTASNGYKPAATSGKALPHFSGGQVAARGGVARRRLVAERRVRRLLYRSTHCIVTYSTSSRHARARQKWAAPTDGFGFEQPDRRLGRALAYASPTHPIDAATSSSTTVSANAIEAGRAS